MRRAFFAVAAPVSIAAGLLLPSWLDSRPAAPTVPGGRGADRIAPAVASWGGAAASPRPAGAQAAAFVESPGSAYLMGAAHVTGFNDTQWRTSLEVCNFSGTTQPFELAFLHRGQSNPLPQTAAFTLAPGVCATYPDVVQDVFELDEAAGAIRLDASGEGIVAVARTYNETPLGTYGSAFTVTPADRAVAEGEGAVLIHLSQSADDASGSRTNLDLLNVTERGVTVEIALYSSAGTLYDTLTTTLLPFEYDQVFRVFRQATDAQVDDGYAVVTTSTPGGAVLAGASLIDNRTGDTTAIDPFRLPAAERWLEPRNLGAVVNSNANDWYPVLARDGSFMIFVSDRPGGYGSADLYISRRVDGAWQEPVNLGPGVNSSGMESAPYLSADDATLYFASFAAGGFGEMDVWSCPLVDGVAGERVNLGERVNTPYLDCCPVISADGTLLYMCSNRPGGHGNMDVWVSHKVGGVWQEPVNLGADVNTHATDCPRWLSDDGATLILASTRGGGLGDADLWYLRKRGDGWWPPINFGGPVNSGSAEWGPGFLGNGGDVGGTMFFGSGRAGGLGRWDIWSSDFGLPSAAASRRLAPAPRGVGSGAAELQRAAMRPQAPARPPAGLTRASLRAMIESPARDDAARPPTTTVADRDRTGEPTCACMREAT